ncbi:hypothetical protein SUDANB58_00954 [Streptomyces sp. enrichment culture]|uniref:hypothetical protein n=1 Tax=Streptomyces sp. enrichment culture TaxID=1795815 RepID=UPI003F56E90D
MTRAQRAGIAIGHLGAVWAAGCVLVAVQAQAVLATLFGGDPVAAAGVLAVMVLPAAAALAPLGAAARAVVPLARRPRGRWAWAAGVHALGTTGASGVVMVWFGIGRPAAWPLFLLAGGGCYALAAAMFLPGARVRATALGTAVALAAVGAYAARDAARPPTLDAWLTANDVDRALLRVGDPPAGHTPSVLGASEDGFGVDYVPLRPARERDGATALLHLGVARAGHDTRRADARGCPVPYGEPVRCTDDGGGRLLVSYGGDHERRELRLSRDGLVYTVSFPGTRADLPAARHVLSTLRPATDAELAALVRLPMRR